MSAARRIFSSRRWSESAKVSMFRCRTWFGMRSGRSSPGPRSEDAGVLKDADIQSAPHGECGRASKGNEAFEKLKRWLTACKTCSPSF